MTRLFAGIVGCVVALSMTASAIADDSTIAQQLSSDLRAAKQSKELQDFRLNVKVENGVVWLNGAVKDAQQKSRALDIARRISGVRLVVNDLTVGDETAAHASLTADSGTSTAAIAPAGANLAATPSAFSSTPEATEIANAIAMSRAASVARPAGAPADAGVMQAASQLEFAQQQTAQLQMEAAQLQIARNRLLQTQIASQRAVLAKQASANRQVNYCADGGCGIGGGGYDGGYDVASGGYGPQHGGYNSHGGAYGGGYGGTDIGYGAGVTHESAQMPGYAWPSYAASPNYAALSYPKQYSAQAWPYIGPFYPYPQVPLGWRKVSLEWDDGWWMLDFSSK